MNIRLFVALILISTVSDAAPEGYRAETTSECTSAEVDPAIKETLQPQGIRVTGDSGVLCEVWLRKAIPQASAGPDYSSIKNGTFAGVIVYTGQGGDYRGQVIKPGTYTMRYQTIPVDGNHMGASPSPDFFLLTPAAEDKDPAVIAEYEKLVAMSRKAAGTNHPACLYLTHPEGGDKPEFKSVEEGHWFLELKTKAQPAGGAEVDFPVAIVLIGKSEA